MDHDITHQSKYLVDLHMHTIASTHAYSTVDEYTRFANQKGLKMIAITDHGCKLPDAPHPWHFINMRVLPRIINGVGILRGIEANIINPQGEIDCDDDMYPHLDIVIAGFHDPVLTAMDIDSNTATMIATIKNPKVNIISHPGNPRYPIHIDAVAKAAKDYNVALEINNSSCVSRRGSDDNCKKIAAAVKRAGGVISFGSDSHVAYTVGDFSHCFELLQNINFPSEQIINKDIQTLLNFLKIKTKKEISEFVNW